MKNQINKILLCIAVGLFWSCATIATGSKQDISVRSQPDNAKVTVSTLGGIEMGDVQRTPAQFMLPKGKEYLVTVELEGYLKKEILLSKEFNTYVIGNLICGGPIGLVVDVLSGSMYNIAPGDVFVTLQLATLDNGQQELYALVSWYDEIEEDIVTIPAKLEKI